MADLVVVVGVLACFGICLLVVRACDALIGPDPADASADPESAAASPVTPGEVVS